MSRVIMNFVVIFIISCQVTSVFAVQFDDFDVDLIEDKTYIKLDLMHAVVIKPHLKNFNGHCTSNCQDYTTKSGLLAYNGRCEKSTTNCMLLASTWCSETLKLYTNGMGQLSVVLDNDTIYANSLSSVKLSEHLTHNNFCNKENSARYKDCHFCICECTHNRRNSDRVRFFSLLPEISNISANMVVIGLRLVRVGKIMHIQIAQSKLSVTNYKIEENDTTIVKNDTTEWTLHSKVKKISTDLMRLEVDQRTVYLDDITLPNDRVLTGVRFKKYKHSKKGALGIEIQGTKVNWKTGELVTTDSKWYDSSDMVKNESESYGLNKTREEIHLNNLQDSLLAQENYQIPDTNKFIKFTTTSIPNTLGNSTIPYFFVKEITGNKPLKGVGLTYEKAKGFGGFIALKTISYNCFTNNLSTTCLETF